MVMDEMTLDQIALAAECVTLARLEFLQAVVLSPLEGIVEALAGVKMESTPAETEAERQAKARERRGRRGPKKKKKRTPEERDAAILAMAARMGIPIEDEKPPGG